VETRKRERKKGNGSYRVNMDRGIFAGWVRACVSLSAQVLLDVVRIRVNALKGPGTGVLGVRGGGENRVR